MMKVLENFNIPSECKIGKRIAKKQFIENFALKSHEKKLLSDEVKSITLEYLLNKDNINITPFVDEDNDYSEIAFIKVELSHKEKVKKISTIIQYIPYPLIVIFVYNNETVINISPKRINKNDATKLVVVKSYFTKWIDIENTSPIEKEFLESLNIKNHPFTDFLSFYNSYVDKIVAFNSAKYTGTLNVNESTKEILEEITSCTAKINELKSKIKKETNFNNKVNMNIEIKRLNDKLNNLKSSL